MIKKSLFLFFILLVSHSWANQDEYLKEVFEKAQNMIKSDNFILVYKQLAEKYESNYYGQMAILELGKTYILERNYQQALQTLKKLDHHIIIEKEYWLGKAYFFLEEYHYAILSAQNFIFESGEHNLTEDSYFLIAESYIKQKLYQRAINTLEYLRESSYICNQIPLLYYKLGFSYEQLKQWEQAINSYKKLKMEFPYNHYTFLAEERMSNLQSPSQGITSKPSNPAVKSDKKRIYLQVGAFGSFQSAEKQKTIINQLGVGCITFSKNSSGKKLYIAAAGPFENDQSFQKAKVLLQKNNISGFKILH